MKSEYQIILQLVDVFANSVVNYSESIFLDHKIANSHYSKYLQALARLNSFGDLGLSALATLLDDDRVVVRVTAAAYLISFRTDKCLKVLIAAKDLKRGIAALAIATLAQWDRGFYLDPATGKRVKRALFRIGDGPERGGKP